MTRQTAAPLVRVPLNTGNRRAVDLVGQIHAGQIDLNPPYQRGAVWTEDQQMALIFSLLSGLNVPNLIINMREYGAKPYGVIDGQQRLRAVMAWLDGELAVPASWFPADMVNATTATEDGPYVTYTGLTQQGQAYASRITLAVDEGSLPTVEDEARVYLVVNGAGTPQSDADMANAAGIAEGN
jgi:hypothetical protein